MIADTYEVIVDKWHTDYQNTTYYTGELYNTDDKPLFDDPNILPVAMWLTASQSAYPGTGIPTESNKTYYYDVQPLQYFITKDCPILNYISFLEGARIYYVKMTATQDTGGLPPAEYGVYYAGYTIADIDNQNYMNNLYKLMPEDLSIIKPINPEEDIYTPTFNGSNWFEFLAGFGNNLMQDNWLIELLQIDIGGYNIMAIVFGAGFIVYIGWAVIKWAIPV